MATQLVPGAVVSFNGEGEYEVLDLQVNARTVRIQGEGGEPLTVRYEPDLLQPVARHPGDQVRSLISGMVGMIVLRLPDDAGLAYYRVQFPDGRTRTVSETALRGVPITDPLELLSRGMVEQVCDFQLRTM